jgi:exodeoxyribonuclease VII large subunit
LEMRLHGALSGALGNARQQLERLDHKLQGVNPQRQLAGHAHQLQLLHLRLEAAQRKQLDARQQRLQRAAGLLHSVSPLNTLSRGYAILLTAEGQAVRDADEVTKGQQLTAKLHKGELLCEVKGSTP